MLREPEELAKPTLSRHLPSRLCQAKVIGLTVICTDRVRCNYGQRADSLCVGIPIKREARLRRREKLLSQGRKDKGIFLQAITLSKSEVNRIQVMAKQCFVICPLTPEAQILKSPSLSVGFERVGLPGKLRHDEVYIWLVSPSTSSSSNFPFSSEKLGWWIYKIGSVAALLLAATNHVWLLHLYLFKFKILKIPFLCYTSHISSVNVAHG